MRRRRWGIVLGSVALHALLVLLFVLDIGRGPVATPQPPMTVWLERPPALPKRAPSSARGGATRAVQARTQARTQAAPAVLPAEPAAPVAKEGVAEQPASGVGAAPDLRGLGGGCRLATLERLSPEARARCQEQLAGAMSAGRAPRPNFDPIGRYARDAKPYLTRPPKNGLQASGRREGRTYGPDQRHPGRRLRMVVLTKLCRLRPSSLPPIRPVSNLKH